MRDLGLRAGLSAALKRWRPGRKPTRPGDAEYEPVRTRSLGGVVGGSNIPLAKLITALMRA
jgi:hypothetical protein